MRNDTLNFAKEVYFSGHSDTRSVKKLQFDYIFHSRFSLLHISSKTSRSVSSVPWITPENKKKRFARKVELMQKLKRPAIRSKFETLRREIKADIRKHHDLYLNNLVGDVKANPRDFYRYINSQKKIPKVFPL